MAKQNGKRVSVFVGASLDGFIARENGDIDWLEGAGDANVDYGFNEFFARVDALVMGRGTYEKMLTFPKWYYGDKPVFVLSHRPLKIPARLPKTVENISGSPKDIVARLAKRGFHRLYVDGGKTIQGFLREGLVDELTVSWLPILIGKGIPLFGSVPKDVPLHHVSTRTFPAGMVQSAYEFDKVRDSGLKKRTPKGTRRSNPAQ